MLQEWRKLSNRRENQCWTAICILSTVSIELFSNLLIEKSSFNKKPLNEGSKKTGRINQTNHRTNDLSCGVYDVYDARNDVCDGHNHDGVYNPYDQTN